MEAIVKNVLATSTLDEALKELNFGSDFLLFSISGETSNHGNRKMFPCVIRYFTPENCIQNKIIDFYEDANETAIAISDKIINILKSMEVSTKNLISFSADNAAVNYGKHNAVFKILKDNHVPNLIKANCLCHALLDTVRQVTKHSFNVEKFVIKVYNEFSNSAQNVEQLKECFNFANMEYEHILRHVPTRWLSLFPAIDRL